MAKTSFKVVPDTNVLIASEKSISESSPNKEFFERWRNEEFDILYSDDTLLEYIEKMREKDIPEEIIKKLIRAILELGRNVYIIFYHLPFYPVDSDDIAFLLCAENGKATHVVSYDSHLKSIEPFYSFKVCETKINKFLSVSYDGTFLLERKVWLEFLFELRKELVGNNQKK